MEEMPERLKYLLNQYANHIASPSEESELFEIIDEAQHDDHIKVILLSMMQAEPYAPDLAKDQWEPVLKKVLGQEDNNNRGSPSVEKTIGGNKGYTSPIKLYLKKFAIAASILVVLSTGWYYLFLRNHLPSKVVMEGSGKPGNIISPGRSQAILTLADGSAINLDSVKNGMLARQGDIEIVKGDHGKLSYNADQQNTKTVGYNTVSIPRGGTYQIVLSDGSKVWLNAASSLKFPASFTGKSRDVTLTGEAYFEVAKNASIPFRVTVNDMTVEVLGTHFNVNAYSDELSVATTLLEGSVKVNNRIPGNSELHTVLLSPGEEADVAADGKLKVNYHPNVQQIVAWKENKFEFNNADIPAIMRQISRWYDVEVEYKGSIPTRKLTGKFKRSINLRQLIEMIQYTGVNMKIENKKIIVQESGSN